MLPDLPEHVVRELGAESRVLVYMGGETILKAGQSASPGVVLEGLLRLYIQANDGRQATLRYVRPGRVLAMMTPFQPMPGTLTAVVNSTVIHFGESASTRLARNNAAFAWELARALSDWSQYLSASFASVAFGTMRERIAAHLLELAIPQPGTGQLELHMTQQALADAVGSVREVVSRTLKNLRAMGLIHVSGSTITIVDEQRLRRESVCKALT
jgi:CRP/FNR family cyclic AMP-dependent transcriptional regulator